MWLRAAWKKRGRRKKHRKKVGGDGAHDLSLTRFWVSMHGNAYECLSRS